MERKRLRNYIKDLSESLTERAILKSVIERARHLNWEKKPLDVSLEERVSI